MILVIFLHLLLRASLLLLEILLKKFIIAKTCKGSFDLKISI